MAKFIAVRALGADERVAKLRWQALGCRCARVPGHGSRRGRNRTESNETQCVPEARHARGTGITEPRSFCIEERPE